MPLLFSRGLISKYLVTILTYISLKDCTDECVSRSTCALLLYNRRSKVCELHTNKAAVPDNIIPVPGTVLVTDIDHNLCPTDCTSDSSTKRECPHPEMTDYTLLQGNMFSVGDTVSVHLRLLLPYQITCFNTGEWKLVPEPEYCLDCRDCTDFKLQGHTGSGIYFVNSTFQIYCTFDAEGQAWLTFQKRQDGSIDFYKNWDGYMNGFGYFEGEFWFGLEPLYRILNQFPGQYELRVDIETFEGSRYYETYSTFHLADASDNFRLSVADYAGNAGDSLSYHNGRAFTTYDRDNDFNPQNCAEKFHGAWWYGSCHTSNLNGLYYPNGHYVIEYATHIHWFTLTGYHVSLKKTEMKIRRLA